MQLHTGLVLLLLYTSLDLCLFSAAQWNYGALGPDVWPDLYPTCGGKSQSPININTACTTYQCFPSFQFSSAYDAVQNFNLQNDGIDINTEQVDPTKFTPILTGGGLDEPFTFKNLHVHWGENYASGIEHQM